MLVASLQCLLGHYRSRYGTRTKSWRRQLLAEQLESRIVLSSLAAQWPETHLGEAEAFGQPAISLTIAADSVAENAGPGATTGIVTRSNPEGLVATLTPDHSTTEQYLGYSSAMSDSAAIVGSPGGDGNDSRTGAAYVLEASGQVTKLTASDGTKLDQFGRAVSISGDRAIVGAPDDPNGAEFGSAYLFSKSGSTWVQTQKLVGREGFGTSVAISGNISIVGAPYQPYSIGSAFIFGGAETVTLHADSSVWWGQFGYSAAISGNTVIVGSPGEGDSEGPTGTAYIFERTGETWRRAQRIKASDASTGSGFGRAVAISGTRAIVGACDAGTGGVAYIYENVSGSWVQVAKLTASDGKAQDVFGISVAIFGNTAVVGASGAYDDNGKRGAAYIFDQSGTTWREVAKLTNMASGDDDGFGRSVSIWNNRLISGSPWGLGGAAYVFETLPVNLSSNDLTEATVPTTVTLPWGQSSATFNIDAVDDAFVDGPQTVTVTASATDYIAGSDTLFVTDDET